MINPGPPTLPKGRQPRNASATRIPTIRTRKQQKPKQKQLKMNMSVDAAPQAHPVAKSASKGKLLSSSEDDMPEEDPTAYNSYSYKKETTIEQMKKQKKSAGFKGYTPTGVPPNKIPKAPLYPQNQSKHNEEY